MGRKPLYPQKYHNVGDMYTPRSTAVCKYYESHNDEFIKCDHLFLSRDDYDLDSECCANCEECPQYKYLDFYYNEQDKQVIREVLKQLENEVRSGKL